MLLQRASGNNFGTLRNPHKYRLFACCFACWYWFDTTNPVQWDAVASRILPNTERARFVAGILFHYAVGNKIYPLNFSNKWFQKITGVIYPWQISSQCVIFRDMGISWWSTHISRSCGIILPTCVFSAIIIYTIWFWKRRIAMPVSYDKLRKLLIDKKMKRTELKDAAGISFNVLATLWQQKIE